MLLGSSVSSVTILMQLLSILLASLMALPVFAVNPQIGNGAPSGAHYSLNIIGAPNPKNVNFDGGNGAS